MKAVMTMNPFDETLITLFYLSPEPQKISLDLISLNSTGQAVGLLSSVHRSIINKINRCLREDLRVRLSHGTISLRNVLSEKKQFSWLALKKDSYLE